MRATVCIVYVCTCLYACIQLSWAQFDLRQQAFRQQSAAAAMPVQNQCPEGCPPSWTMLLNNPMVPTLQANDRICTSARQHGIIADCMAGNTCGRNVVPFHCCPRHCLSKIPTCLPGTGNICVPSNIQPWMSLLMGAFMG